MTNKFAIALCACLLSITALAFGIRAEDYEDAPVEAPPAAVEPTPAEDVARVPVEIDADALAEALTQALATPTPDPDTTPEPEQPTPTPQIIVIQATPETAPTPEPTTAPHDLEQALQRLQPHRGPAAGYLCGAVLHGAAHLVEVKKW